MTREPILIAGGGIGGAAAALALARQGWPVRVLEQLREFGEIGADPTRPECLQDAETLGLTGAIDATAVRPDALVMRDALDGEIVTRVPLNNAGFAKSFSYPYAVTYRADLHNALIDACNAEPEIELAVAAKVTGFTDSNDGVSVQLEDGGRIEGRALIGADGLWSNVREILIGDGPPRISGHIAYRAVLPATEMPKHLRWNEVVLWAGPRTHLVQYPLRRGEIFNLVAVFHSDMRKAGTSSVTLEELFERFSGEHPHVLELLGRIEPACGCSAIANQSRIGAGFRHPARGCGPPDAAVSGARRLHGHRRCCLPGPHTARISRRLSARTRRRDICGQGGFN